MILRLWGGLDLPKEVGARHWIAVDVRLRSARRINNSGLHANILEHSLCL